MGNIFDTVSNETYIPQGIFNADNNSNPNSTSNQSRSNTESNGINISTKTNSNANNNSNINVNINNNGNIISESNTSQPKTAKQRLNDLLNKVNSNEANDTDILQRKPPKNKNSKSSCNLYQQEKDFYDEQEPNNQLETGISLPNYGVNVNVGSEDPYEVHSNNLLDKDIDIGIKKIFINQRTQSHSFRIKDNSAFKINDDDSMSIANSNQNDYELKFYRDAEEIRKSYMTKLICTKVWKPSTKEKTHNSLIIFDWDDTLLCTSFLTPNGIFNENMKLTDKEKERVAKLEICVYKILTIAIEKGDVYIITNAGPGWVEFSAEKFYPSIMPLLSKIKIISARGEYEEKYPGDSRMWKIQAFLATQKSFDNDLVTNIICLGDSFIEMEAGKVLANKFRQAFFKTVKFRESPKPEELQKQLTLVATQFNSIYVAIKDLTIKVEKKHNQGGGGGHA